MKFALQMVALVLPYVLIAPTVISKDEPVLAEGVVVAIQRGEKDTRITDPPEFADLQEIYMVRITHWSKPHKEKYIIVEYIHQGGNIGYDQFDKTAWKLRLDPTSPKDNAECHRWMKHPPTSFLPTALGAKDELPNPKELPCFLMTKPPTPVRPTPTTR